MFMNGTSIAAMFRFSRMAFHTLDTEEDDEQELGISEVSSNFEDKSDEPKANNKGQALDEEVTSEAAPSGEDKTLEAETNKSDSPATICTDEESDDTVYYHCDNCRFHRNSTSYMRLGTISGISTCQECNESYSFEDLELVTETYCSRYFDSSRDTVCGNGIIWNNLKAHMKNGHCAKPLEDEETNKSDNPATVEAKPVSSATGTTSALPIQSEETLKFSDIDREEENGTTTVDREDENSPTSEEPAPSAAARAVAELLNDLDNGEDSQVDAAINLRVNMVTSEH